MIVNKSADHHGSPNFLCRHDLFPITLIDIYYLHWDDEPSCFPVSWQPSSASAAPVLPLVSVPPQLVPPLAERRLEKIREEQIRVDESR